MMPTPMTPAQTALQQAIAACTAQGWRLQSAGTDTAVMVSGQGAKTNHMLHALLSLFTCGLWLIVWLGIVLFSSTNTEKSLLITVDPLGNVSYQPGT